MQNSHNMPLSQKNHYTTIFSLCFSPCGNYLAAANNHGEIALFNIYNLLHFDTFDCHLSSDPSKPTYKFQAHDGSIYALASTDLYLISAGIGDILAWSWNDIISKNAKVAWSLTVPQSDIGKPETNAVIVDSKDTCTVYSGGGDNKIYSWDIEMRKKKAELIGHTDYIHCLTLCNIRHCCVSGSEDGSVRTWDFRKSAKEVASLEPFKHEKCSRSKFGKWIGCVTVDDADDWLLCGGGPCLTSWHLRSASPTTIFDSISAPVNWCGFYDDLVLAGGGQYLYHYTHNGDLRAQIPSSSSSIYSVAIGDFHQNKILATSGTSHKIDICSQFKYKDLLLTFI